MKFRIVHFALVSIAAFSPVMADASPEKDALNACAHAFASSLATSGARAPAFKLNYHAGESPGSMIEFYNREYTFELHAQDPKTGQPLGHASCSTDIHGTVVEFSAMPLGTIRPTLAYGY